MNQTPETCGAYINVTEVFPEFPVFCAVSSVVTQNAKTCRVLRGGACYMPHEFLAPEIVQELIFEGLLQANKARDYPK